MLVHIFDCYRFLYRLLISNNWCSVTLQTLSLFSVCSQLRISVYLLGWMPIYLTSVFLFACFLIDLASLLWSVCSCYYRGSLNACLNDVVFNAIDSWDGTVLYLHLQTSTIVKKQVYRLLLVNAKTIRFVCITGIAKYSAFCSFLTRGTYNISLVQIQYMSTSLSSDGLT